MQLEVKQLKHAGTWSSTAVKIAGQNVQAEIPVVAPDVRRLLGEASIDSGSEAGGLQAIGRCVLACAAGNHVRPPHFAKHIVCESFWGQQREKHKFFDAQG